jgi:pimeloyl-ACP methyl ester carboxylesterase
MVFVALIAAGCAAPAPAATSPAPTAAATANTTTGGLTLTPCQLSLPGAAQRVAAECGQVLVYEDRASGSGRQISLRVAVLRASGQGPAADPLVFLAGGPGQASSEAFVLYQAAFSRINRQRDIVLMDQRGTGGSNALTCPPIEDPLALVTPEQASAEAQACLAQLAGDPRFYTTSLAADDLDDVRAALGYQQLNLYGISYGTRLALTYLRQHPDRTRAVILDGVVPQDEALGLEVARDAQHALDLIFARCAADSACAGAFPDLPGDFAAVADDLRQAPARLTLNDPLTGAFTETTFTYDMFANAVRLLSYASETAALLPVLIHTARAEHDYRLLAAQAYIVGRQLGDSLSTGMGTAVLCTEDAPFFTPAQAEQASAGAYMGTGQAELLQAECAGWPAGSIAPGFKDPVTASAPVLLLSGEADPVTPPRNADHAAASLSNSLALTVPGQGHGVLQRGCLPTLAAQFIQQASPDGLDASCVQQIKAAPFFTSLTGPEP